MRGKYAPVSFLANAALFQSAVLAYNLLKWMALLSGEVIQQREVRGRRRDCG